MAKKRKKWHAGGQPRWNREHIAALGLATVDQYRDWCRARGLKVEPDKSWRDEKAEIAQAESERGDGVALAHIAALGLATVAEYQAWCGEHGFDTRLDKRFRQRQREVVRMRELKRVAKKERSLRDYEMADTVGPAHWEKLGLSTADEYRQWCRQRGLGESLNKNEDLLRREVELAALSQGRRQARNVQEVIRRVGNGTLAVEALQGEHLLKIHAAFAKAHDRQALLELLLHAERYSNLLVARRGIAQLGDIEGNTLVEGLCALANHGDDWVRPVADWRPDSHNARRQFASLARHLLAEYEIPSFMDAAFFRAGQDGEKQQRWFVHLGKGGNLRKADVSLRLTKKMAHWVLQAPAHYSIEAALRWGQVRGLDGTELLAEAAVQTRLGASFEHEEFWEKVVIFLVEQPMLDPTLVRPIVDYIHGRKFAIEEVVQPGGVVEYRDPPEPNFGMKSRSIFKLLREVEDQQALERKEARRRKRHWKPAGIGDFSVSVPDERRPHYWSVQELLSSGELTQEGRAMNHCVASYAGRCQGGQISVWSLQVETDSSEPRRVMTIAVNNKHRNITETRGKYNALHGFAIDDEGRVPIREDMDPDDIRSHKRLKRNDRVYLQQAPLILHMWMKQEDIT